VGGEGELGEAGEEGAGDEVEGLEEGVGEVGGELGGG
jgi:hypothetical protein